MPPLNRLEQEHFLGILDYTPQWNCRKPKFPNNDALWKEVNDISIQVADLEDGTEASRAIDKLDLTLDQEFYEYHQVVASKMEAFWECIRRAIQVGEDRKLEDLSREDLEDLLGQMLDELSQECPDVMYMNHHKRKIYYQFYDLFVAWGLESVVFFPEINGTSSFVHDNYADKVTKVQWFGDHVLFTHGNQTMKLQEEGVRFSQRSDGAGRLVDYSTLSEYFKDWKKPEPEEVNLFKMLFPEMLYNLDVIRAGTARI